MLTIFQYLIRLIIPLYRRKGELKMWFTLLAPLIPTLVTQAEKLFGKKTGATKLDTVVKAVTPIVNALATSGKLGTVPPTAMEIAAEVAKVAGQLFPSGTTHSDNGEIPGSAEASNNVYVVPPTPTADLAPTTKQDIRKWLIWALSE